MSDRELIEKLLETIKDLEDRIETLEQQIRRYRGR